MQLSAVGAWAPALTLSNRIVSLLTCWPTPQLLTASIALVESAIMWRLWHQLLDVDVAICTSQAVAEHLGGGSKVPRQLIVQDLSLKRSWSNDDNDPARLV
jgi:hypothetical protein